MTVAPGWGEIALRLAMTIVAGTLIGINRGEHGRPAGLRTTLLVCLAASIAMIQANLLLGTVGKAPNSFATLDPMRLPLGILSGMGFLGGGVILKRDNLILGVTTAATLWFVTVIGLCFGAGQLLLGTVALAMGLVVLWGLKWVEPRLRQDRRATLMATLGPEAPSVDEICRRFRADGYLILTLGMTLDSEGGRREVRCELQWRERPLGLAHLRTVEELAAVKGVSSVAWNPQGLPTGLG
jgi:putative Mg2+ transporter-C (MgtC) family protein